MTAKLTLTFDNTPEDIAEAADILAALSGDSDSEPAAGEPSKPRRTRKKKGETATPAAAAPVAAAPATPAAAPAVDPLAVLGGAAPAAGANPLESLLGPGTSAGQLPPVATPAPLVAPAPAPAPVVAQPQLTQQNVIQAFVALGQTPPPKGGIDVVKALLAKYGAATVTAVKPEHFAAAVADIRAALA